MLFGTICLVLFCWLFFKAIGLALTVTWCVGKVIASILFVIALPVMIGGLLLAGGFILLLPIALIAIAIGTLKKCA